MTFKDFETDESLMEEGISFKLLKRLSQRYPRCQFTMVNDVIPDRCTVANACYVRAIVSCNDFEAKCQKTKFKKMITFCELKTDTHNKQNSKLPLSSYLLPCEILEFVLDWEAGKCTLKNIRNMHFKDVAKSVQVRGTKESYSMFYNTSQYEMNLLLRVATKKFLKQLRVANFTFDCKVLNKCKRDEVSNIKCLLYVLLIDV